jgi:hypothetical protein
MLKVSPILQEEEREYGAYHSNREVACDTVGGAAGGVYGAAVGSLAPGVGTYIGG